MRLTFSIFSHGASIWGNNNRNLFIELCVSGVQWWGRKNGTCARCLDFPAFPNRGRAYLMRTSSPRGHSKPPPAYSNRSAPTSRLQCLTSVLMSSLWMNCALRTWALLANYVEGEQARAMGTREGTTVVSKASSPPLSPPLYPPPPRPPLVTHFLHPPTPPPPILHPRPHLAP